MRRESQRPTMKHIAQKTGLTINTVSLALRNSPLVTAETRERVRKAAREIGYVHDALAGSLRSGSSHTVAIVLGDVANPLFAERIKHLERELRERNYRALILNTEEDAQLELEAIRTTISHRVDGVILCPCQKSRESLAVLRQFGVPFVLLGREFADDPMDAVVWDDEKGGLLAASHLLARQCKNIVFLNAALETSSATRRLNGYARALMAAGQSVRVCEAQPMAGGVQSALCALFSGTVPVDALFAFNDLMAFEAASWLKARGLCVPRDVRLVGFDDILSSISLPFGLTSVSADKREEARQTVEMLLRRMENPSHSAEHIVLDVRLIERESSL